MRTLFLIALILGTTSIQAEELPNGCYVSYNDVNHCWSPSDYSVTWESNTDQSSTVLRYGPAMALVIIGDRANVLQLNQCQTDYNNLVNSYNSVATQSITNYNAYKKQVALVKKLKRACGTKCRSIR